MAAALRWRHRLVGECLQQRASPPPPAARIGRQLLLVGQTRQRSSEDEAVDEVGEKAEDELPEDAESVAADYARLPVQLSLCQAACAMSLDLIRLVDGRSVAALRHSGGLSMSTNEAAERSAMVRLLYLTSQRAEDTEGQSSAAPTHPLPSSSTGVQPASASSSASSYPAASTPAIATSRFSHHPLAFTLPILLCSPSTSISSIPPALLPLPPSSVHQLVFADLYARGFTLTSASQYGGHFLLYDGDPSSCHAHSIVRVVEREKGGVEDGEGVDGQSRIVGVGGMELLALVRVGSGVRKSVVVAWVEVGEASSESTVRYLTLGWEAELSSRLSRHTAPH